MKSLLQNKKLYVPVVEDYNVMINGRNFSD